MAGTHGDSADAASVLPGSSPVLPSELLRQAADDAGSKIVLVVGAGVSIEAPTSLATGAVYARDAHRRLVQDGVLNDGDCSDPSDLSILADVVFEQKNGSQRELTSRLPRDAWRTARPNRGHLLTAALLTEGVIHHVLSLNYDLAIQNAFSQLGNPGGVSFVHGPDDHNNVGSHAVIYLHRSVDQDEESWVLRKTALENDWREGWEGVVAAANLAAPLTVFVGLGSPAQVLTDSVERLASAAQSQFFLVDPNPDSKFSEALGDNLAGTVPMYWNAFMAALADRVASEQVERLRVASHALIQDQPELDPENFDDVLEGLEQLDLLALGRTRARWLQEQFDFLGEGDAARRTCVADLLLGVGWIMKVLGANRVDFDGDFRATVTGQGPLDVSFSLLHGQGIRTWAAVSARLKARNESLPPQQRMRHVLVAGLRSMADFDIDDLIRGDMTDDLIRGADTLVPIPIDEARLKYQDDPDSLKVRLT